MSKKSRRQPTKYSTPSTSYKSPTTGERLASTRLSEPVFNPDYTYVRQDLRRIGILAGSIFVGLIILYFLLPYLPYFSSLYAR